MNWVLKLNPCLIYDYTLPTGRRLLNKCINFGRESQKEKNPSNMHLCVQVVTTHTVHELCEQFDTVETASRTVHHPMRTDAACVPVLAWFDNRSCWTRILYDVLYHLAQFKHLLKMRKNDKDNISGQGVRSCMKQCGVIQRLSAFWKLKTKFWQYHQDFFILFIAFYWSKVSCTYWT